MAKTKSLKPDQFIVKSNSLIEARYRLSLQESHVILWLLTQIKPDDEDFKSHSMKISEFAKMIGVEVDSQYKELRKVTMRLIQRGLSIYEPEAREWLQVSWLNSARYKAKEGTLSLGFSTDLKPYLLQLKRQFTKIDIADTMKFKSIYALRIFELLLQYEPIGKRETSIDELRAWCGIKETEYKDYFDLKRKVINRAKTEITAKTEYNVDYKEIKESRKIVGLDWTFKKKTHFEKAQLEKAALIDKELQSKNAIIGQLLEYGFPKQVANRLIKNHEEIVIINAIKAVEAYMLKHTVKNPRALLYTAITEKWHSEKYVAKK